MSDEHVILVAFTVEADHMREAQHLLMDLLTLISQRSDENLPVSSWWIAMDERHDGSDCDSAEFVPTYETWTADDYRRLLKRISRRGIPGQQIDDRNQGRVTLVPTYVAEVER